MANRPLRTLSIFTLLILLSGSCSLNPPIKIGLLANFTGPAGETGYLARLGIMLAVLETNEAGGIQGRQVELLVRDDGSDPEQTRVSTEELIKEGVVAIIGPYTSGTSKVALSVCNQAGVLLFSPITASEEFTAKDDMFFRFAVSTALSSRLYADRIIQHYGLKRSAIIWDTSNAVYSSEWKTGFINNYTAQGGKIVGAVDFFPAVDLNMKPLAAELLEGNPEAIVCITNSFYTAALAQQIRKLDSAVHLFASEWTALTDEFITLGGASVEGLEILNIFEANSSEPEYIGFKKTYAEYYSAEPELTGVITYEAARVIFQGLAVKGKKESLKNAIIRNSPYKGLQWNIRFDEFGEARITPSFYIVSGNRLVKVP